MKLRGLLKGRPAAALLSFCTVLAMLMPITVSAAPVQHNVTLNFTGGTLNNGAVEYTISGQNIAVTLKARPSDGSSAFAKQELTALTNTQIDLESQEYVLHVDRGSANVVLKINGAEQSIAGGGENTVGLNANDFAAGSTLSIGLESGNTNPPSPGRRDFQIVLEDVGANGTLSDDFGQVWCDAMLSGSAGTSLPIGVDHDGAGTDAAVTIGDNGGPEPKLMYTYTLSSNQMLVKIAPANGKIATVQRYAGSGMIGEETFASSSSIAMNPGERISISFSGPRPMPDKDGTDVPAPNKAPKIRFIDMYGNSFYYDKFHADYTVGVMGTVEYSYNGNDWFGFGENQVGLDDNLLWNTQGVAENKVHTYYFWDSGNDTAVGTVYIRVVEGDITCENLGGKLEKGVAYTINTDTTYGLVHDDGTKTLIWSDESGDADARVEHGKVIVESATLPNGDNALKKDGPFSQQGNKGYLGIKGGASVTVKLIPDYGYQVGSLSLNGRALTPQAEEATYTFIMPDTNLHLSAVFEQSTDEINVNADGVSGGSITGGEKVIDSGNLRLSVSETSMNDTQKAEMQDSAAAENTDIFSFLEVDLEKFVRKGNSKDEWIEDLEELSEKITITLNVGTALDEGRTYVVIREHNGVYEQIPALYDKAAGTLTFESDKFSAYALAAVNTAEKPGGTNSTAKSAAGPKTGDSAGMTRWLILLLASGAGIAGTKVYVKKRKM